MFFNWLLFAFSIFAMFMFHLQIVKVEEVFLSTVFGSDYENYRKKVNRYLGRKYNGKGIKNHEIYLSDARKVAPEKWKTVIRHPIKRI